jgi:hypothetical protein
MEFGAGQAGMGERLDRLSRAFGPLAEELLPYVLAVLIAIVAFYLAWKLLKPRWGKLPPAEPDLTIDVTALSDEGPPPGAPVLEHYHLPMRLAAVVVAPAGRAGQLPLGEHLGDLFEAVVPGLAQVVAVHHALVRRWPRQLSTTGFAHAFFRHVKLPGKGGKGTRWCSAAGVARMEGRPVMVGLLMQSEHSNSLGQVIVQRETKWLDVVRIKPPQ